MFSWKEDYFSPSPKVKLFYRACLPPAARGHVIVLHGYAEHSGRYRGVMEYLAGRGFAAYAPDHRGHGRSARCLGDMDSFEGVVADLAAFKDRITVDHNARPLFLLGHSLGGCLALCLSVLHPEGVSGVVAIAPMIVIPDYASPLLIAVSRLLSRLLPRLPAQAFPVKDVCRDEKVLDAARRDPLYYRGKMRARTGYQLLRGIRRARGLLKDVSLPLLLLHGGADRVMPPVGSRFLLENVSSRDKSLTMFDGLYHEILNEPEKAEVFAAVGAWLDEH